MEKFGLYLKKASFLASLIVLISCSTAIVRMKNITIDGVVFKNLTDQPMRNMRILVTKTNAFAVCSYMTARGECSTTFPVRQYKGNAISISWEQNNKSWSKEDFYIETPTSLDWGKPARAVINLMDGGDVQAGLLQ